MAEEQQIQEADFQPLDIEYVDIDVIKGWDRNPKDHDVPGLQSAFDRWGFIAPLGRNEETGELLWGHGRLEALLDLKDRGLACPRGIKFENGYWLAPVIIGNRIPEGESRAYTLADNRLSEKVGWVDEALLAVIDELQAINIDVSGVGFSEDDIANLREIFGHPDLDELEEEYGDPEESDFWPRISMAVPPGTFARFEELMDHAPGQEEYEKFAHILSLIPDES